MEEDRTKSEGVQTEFEDVAWPSIKRQSVIEEWQNPSSGPNYVIKGDQLYEERAVDVIRVANPPPDLIQRREEDIRRPTEERGSMIKIKKPQGGGTVRNIPIKDYQASIAANFDTLRRSAQPQQQFESLVSEPEKGFRLSGTTKQRSSLIPRVRKSSLKVRKGTDIPQSGKKMIESPLSGRKIAGIGEESDFRRGHVVQKISAYEENSREPKRKSIEICKRHQLGVPLVGMHNACGLPVIAPWPVQVNLNPIRASKKVAATLRPITKIPLTVPTGRSRTQPKRRAPQRPSNLEDEFRVIKKKTPTKSHRDIFIRDSSAPESAVISRKKTKNQRRPSFKVNRINATFPLRNSRDSLMEKSNRITFRSVKDEAKTKSPLLGSFQRRSCKKGTAKRKTLYARAEGDDAANVLSNLCLNPLARSKEAANMIW